MFRYTDTTMSVQQSVFLRWREVSLVAAPPFPCCDRPRQMGVVDCETFAQIFSSRCLLACAFAPGDNRWHLFEGMAFSLPISRREEKISFFLLCLRWRAFVVFVKTMKYLAAGILSMAFAAIAHAEESRTWTSIKGSTMDATLAKMQGEEVFLVTKDRKEIKLPVTSLSLADRQFLVENVSAPETILSAGALSLPEKELKFDSKTCKKLKEKFKLSAEDSEGMFEQMETEHFLILYAGDVRPNVVAEIAERLWHGMAFYHMNFRRDWADKRRVIFCVEDRKVHAALGKWYADELSKDAKTPEAQQNVQSTIASWNRAGAMGVQLPDAMCEEKKLHRVATLLNLDNNRQFKKVFTPFPTHVIAGHLLNQQMGGTRSIGNKGYFTIVTGHAYYKEIKLAGETETHLLDVGGTGGDEISSKSGFDDGSAWARILKTEVKREKIKPNLLEILAVESDTLTPAKLVLVYSFANYLQSNPKRVSAFARMIRRIESNNTIPEPEELAKIYGFASVEAMEKDWIAYITSNDFS